MAGLLAGERWMKVVLAGSAELDKDTVPGASVDGMGGMDGSTEAALTGRAGLDSDTVAATERGRGG